MPLIDTPKSTKRLVLCFDGTGNTFSGSTSDTNIVKLYDKFDRDADDQYHYYQTGIGTYDISGGSLNKGFFGRIRSNISKTIDSGIGTTFDAHVIAGYRFVMRYYDSRDKIYMFGFSRGAYTARFLARMINTVGLLSKGNEEMVPFAYELFQRYEQGKLKNYDNTTTTTTGDGVSTSETATLVDARKNNGYNDQEGEAEVHVNELHAFSRTFCRREGVGTDPLSPNYYYTGVKVFFLGIFDCVNSVAVLEAQPPTPIPVVGTAKHVRHAVAIDERRVKFKAALLDQDPKDKPTPSDPRSATVNAIDPHTSPTEGPEDRKEVWFPGNHGDVGGGWPAPYPPAPSHWTSFTAYLKSLFTSTPDDRAAETGPLQMSDIPLAWMLRELEQVDRDAGAAAVKFSARKDRFLTKLARGRAAALAAPAHDTMTLRGGSGLTMVLLWNFMEWLPFFPRLEYNAKDMKHPKWHTVRAPNRGRTRDMPFDAVVHASVVARLRGHAPRYEPRNGHGGRETCLTAENLVADRVANQGVVDEGEWVYRFRK